MPQVTIYLDEETAARARAAAKSAGMSYSKWIAQVLREKTRKEWPQWARDLAGAWPDFPEPTALREHRGQDAHREKP